MIIEEDIGQLIYMNRWDESYLRAREKGRERKGLNTRGSKKSIVINPDGLDLLEDGVKLIKVNIFFFLDYDQDCKT